MAKTIMERMERIPPFVCRLVARTCNGRVGMSHRDIVRHSGLDRGTVRKMSYATSFRFYTLETGVAFAMACGVNHLAAGKQLDFLKRRKWTHVENATGNQAKMYQRLKRLLVAEAQKRKNNQNENSNRP